jgi:hypothetical protein
MRTIYTNGRIYTAARTEPFVEAIVLDGDRIVFAGDLDIARREAGAEASVVDLQGRMMMPGLHDAHTHLLLSGLKHLQEIRLTPFAPAQKIIEELLAAHAPGTGEDSCCEWIVGGEVFPPQEGEERLTREQLDAAYPEDPVYLYDYSIHHGVANTKALELAGISETDEHGRGGMYIRGEDGRLTGELVELATAKVLRTIPPYPEAVCQEALEWAVHLCHKFGITSIQEASASPAALQTYRDLDKQGKLPLNVTAHLVWGHEGFARASVEELDALLEDFQNLASKHVDTRFVKIWIDGAPLPPISTHAPLTSEGHVDDTWLLVQEDELTQLVARFDAEGRTVKIHCAGDGAVHTALNAIERVRAQNGDGKPHEIAHAGFVTENDYPRFAKLNVTAEMSPALWHIPEYGLGEGFKFAKMLENGARMTIGSDWIITPDPNLFPGIQGALQHASHPISLTDALEAVTRIGAEAVGKGDERGTLQAGKKADFIILDRDLFSVDENDIGATVVLETFVDGVRVYEASLSERTG